MAERVLVVRRLLAATPERVFQAWTDARLLSRWFFAGETWTAKVENDPRVGGAYRIDMITPEGVVHTQSGVYRAIDPPRRISFTWSNELVGDTLVVIELSARGDRTELVLTHYLPEQEVVERMHREGWEGCLASLERLLA
jgi:uncharacterized protein YndB with AHSA1/START domain